MTGMPVTPLATQTPTNTRLAGLQSLRGLAALMVLIGHILAEAEHYRAAPLPLAALPWSRGVDIFFVISGFIISLSLHRHIARPLPFLARRLWRVAPLYYLFTTLMLLTLLLLPGAAKDSSLDLAGALHSYAFLPHARPDGRIAPLLSLGWTLNYEVFFYVLCALCLAMPAARSWIATGPASCARLQTISLSRGQVVQRPSLSARLAAMFTSPARIATSSPSRVRIPASSPSQAHNVTSSPPHQRPAANPASQSPIATNSPSRACILTRSPAQTQIVTNPPPHQCRVADRASQAPGATSSDPHAHLTATPSPVRPATDGSAPLSTPLPLICAILGFLALCGLLLSPLPLPLQVWSNPLILEFCYGIALAAFWQRGWRRASLPLALLALGTGLALLVALDATDLPRFIAAGLPALLITAAATLFCPARRLPGRVLGDASYALYLSHRFALRLTTLLVLPLLPATPLGLALYLGLALATCLALALFTHRFVETPLLRLATPPGPRKATS
ncbi:acyltransferase family protein [Sulfitobacter aestuarii]|uniref:Acyltransferase family protein n=1 Tax=Sulfitobacter aestuarii TaxID=2161676 RepID=A0ABW5U3W5_9RHOB